MQNSMQTPRFLRAKTPQSLEQAMLTNNLARKTWHQYQIVFDGKFWFAWYYVDLSGNYNQEIKEVLKGE